MYIEDDVWKNYLDNSFELFILVGKSFLESYKDFKKKIEREFDLKEIDLIHEDLHSIKGITLNLGMSKLDIAVEEALRYIRKDILDKDSIENMLDIFSSTYIELENIIKKDH